jgi:hypothetical protein
MAAVSWRTAIARTRDVSVEGGGPVGRGTAA